MDEEMHHWRLSSYIIILSSEDVFKYLCARYYEPKSTGTDKRLLWNSGLTDLLLFYASVGLLGPCDALSKNLWCFSNRNFFIDFRISTTA